MKFIRPLGCSYRTVAGVSIALAIGWMVGCGAMNFVAYQFIQKSLGISPQGDFRPSLLMLEFELRKVEFVWKDRVRVTGGNLRVKYPLSISMLGGKLRIQLSGVDAVINLEGAWAAMQGTAQEKLHTLNADVTLNTEGLEEIHDIIAESPTFHFAIRKNIKEATP